MSDDCELAAFLNARVPEGAVSTDDALTVVRLICDSCYRGWCAYCRGAYHCFCQCNLNGNGKDHGGRNPLALFARAQAGRARLLPSARP